MSAIGTAEHEFDYDEPDPDDGGLLYILKTRAVEA